MNATQKIVPHLWFDTQAKEAAEFYVSVFPESEILNITTLQNTPSGDTHIVNMLIYGHHFQSISAGPLFKLTPAISFFVTCDTHEQVDALYNALAEGGETLMPVGDYGFSKRYAWVNDKFGVSWQLAAADGNPIAQRLTPMLMFTGAQYGKAAEAVNLYTGLFAESQISHMMLYGEQDAPHKPQTVRHSGFTLLGQQFAALDSPEVHDFTFTEAVSLMVYCDTQAEIDTYWDSLSAHPEAEQCGWLKDRFGVSWQIVPRAMDALLSDPDGEKVGRVTAAFLQMKKFDLAALQRAYDGV